MSSLPGPSNRDLPPPPDCLRVDEPSAVDKARERLSPKRFFLRFPHIRSKKRKETQPDQTQLPSPNDASSLSNDTPQSEEYNQIPSIVLGEPEDGQLVHLHINVQNDVALEEDYGKDVYRWAVLYENQRGFTLFSTPYYSYQGLLPTDPPPFTIPATSKTSRHTQPTVSLSYYPLPDGNWKWVSRTWMVDMRGDGQTQYDGFEYNWIFRKDKWRSEIGFLSAGGWVRRRRWVRLMMRPSQRPKEQAQGDRSSDNLSNFSILENMEGGTTRPPSVITTPDDISSAGDAEIWRGTPEDDWDRCRSALKKLGRDGRRLELWKHWLGIEQPIKKTNGRSSLVPTTRQPEKQWSEDSGLLPSQQSPSLTSDSLANIRGINISQPAREHVATILRQHGEEILHSFIFPDSRAQFIEILGETGLLSDFMDGIGSVDVSRIFDFWSYSSSLDNLSQSDSTSRT